MIKDFNISTQRNRIAPSNRKNRIKQTVIFNNGKECEWTNYFSRYGLGE